MTPLIFLASLLTGVAAAPPAASASDPLAYTIVAPGAPRLLIRHEPGPGASVLVVHGATFPSASAAAYRIDGTSWMDDLHRRGFDVWAFDFAGYGGSERERAFLNDDLHAAPYGDAPMAARQIERVAAEIRRVTGHARINIVAHSWGTIPTGLFVTGHPGEVERLVLFGPVGPRTEGKPPAAAGTAILVSRQDQWNGFSAGRPDAKPYMEDGVFEPWVDAYLASDERSARRTPPSVRVPSGPDYDVALARSGHYPYDPSGIRVPSLLVRGAWDVNTTAEDMAALATVMTGVPGGVQTVTLARGTHRMHLEANRLALFDAVGGFLARPTKSRR